MTGWRDDGHGADEVELWAVGYPSGADAIPTFAGDSTAPCLPDTDYSAYFGLDASKDDLFVIDQGGAVVFYSDVALKPLYTTANRDQVDAVVRGLLP